MRTRAFRWWIAAFLTFWGTVAAVFLVSYLTQEQGPFAGHTVGRALLDGTLFLGVVSSGCLLLTAVVKTAIRCKTAAGVSAALLFGAIFAAVNYCAFFVVGLWFVIHVMRWDSL
jgi:hypothetical protein